MDFPIYRKYKGIEVWFKVYSETEFDEIKKVGSKTILTKIVAKIFPEKQFITDLINCYEDRWEVIDEAEFNAGLGENIKPVK